MNYKNDGHAYFDILWVYKHYHSGKTASYWRNKTYKWLAKKLGIPKKDCHFATMTQEQMKNAIDICAEEFANNDKLINFAEDLEAGKISSLGWFRRKYYQYDKK